MKTAFLVLLGLLLRMPALEALDFPGLAAGPARSSAEGTRFTLENDLLSASWELRDGTLRPLSFINKLRPDAKLEPGPNLFQIALQNGAPALVAEGAPALVEIKPLPRAARAGDRLRGKALVENFRDARSGVAVEWRAELRDGGNEVRQIITLSGGGAAVLLKHVTLEDFQGSSASVSGSVPGSPVIEGNAFFGFELPFAQAAVDAQGFRFGFDCALPLDGKHRYSFSSVGGVFPDGQLRRAFLYYLERERAMPYAPFLHYNCWFDLGKGVNEKGMTASIEAIHAELTEKRGVALDSYVIDDGWDNSSEGFWTPDKTKFPSGLAPLSSLLLGIHSHLGIWISPLGGYAERDARTEQARKLGLVEGKDLDLANPKYYAWFEGKCAHLIQDDQVNYFKWDKAGDGVTPHFMALLSCASELRKLEPKLFLNVTVGTWPSPFWLNHIDSTWRDGQDTGWSGKGDDREQWVTYRDGQLHRSVVQRGPLYPLNSIMVHGVVLADGVIERTPAARAKIDLRHDVRMYFGLGANLQELYVQHDRMTPENWDAVAESALWARRNANVLVDTHWIGGDPNQLEPYGFASWSPRKATLAVRNPDDAPRDLVLDAAKIWELPEGAAQRYVLRSPYGDQRVKDLEMVAGQAVTLHLEPFEVLVFDARPQP